jgi:hypothetical protein
MLQTKLLKIMKRELQSQNLQLSSDCIAQIEKMVRYGIQRMRANHSMDNAGHVIQAERNMRFLVRYFCDYSRDMGTHPKLSNSDFNQALNACPTLWPFNSST